MSLESAKKCFKEALTSESFAQKLTTITSEEEFFAYAKDLGYDFTLDEWEHVKNAVDSKFEAYLEENNIEIPDELTDGELDSVAGGGGWKIGLGSVFGAIGGWAGGVSGGLAGMTAGALLGPAGVAVGGIAGYVGGTVGGAASGAAFGDTVGGWIEDA